jgi:hypothetical protein
MDRKINEFMNTLTQDEQADYADLERIWDEDFEKAFAASSDQQMEAVVAKPIPEQMEPRFIALLKKLRIHYSKLNLDEI